MGAQAILAQDLVPCTQADTSFPVHLAAMVAMKAMRAMKAMKAGMTASGACSSVAETTGLKTKDVKAVLEGIIEVAAQELKKNGRFKLAGALNLKLKKKPARK